MNVVANFIFYVTENSDVKSESISNVSHKFELIIAMTLKDEFVVQMKERPDSLIKQLKAIKRLALSDKPCLKQSHTEQERTNPKTFHSPIRTSLRKKAMGRSQQCYRRGNSRKILSTDFWLSTLP